MRGKERSVVVPTASLRHVYHNPGEFSAKLLIDPDVSLGIEDVRVEMRNSDGHNMDLSYKRWGTKINICFKIDERTPDGVVILDVFLDGRAGSFRERFDLWVVT